MHRTSASRVARCSLAVSADQSVLSNSTEAIALYAYKYEPTPSARRWLAVYISHALDVQIQNDQIIGCLRHRTDHFAADGRHIEIAAGLRGADCLLPDRL